LRPIFSYTVEIETEELTDLPALYYAIVDSESGEADIKAAIRRELGLQCVVVSDEDITVEDDDAPAIAEAWTTRKSLSVNWASRTSISWTTRKRCLY
jgi:hypothetical protein